MRVTHSDVHYYMASSGVSLDEWEVHSLVDMGDLLVRLIKDPTSTMPKLDMSKLDELLEEASRKP